MFCRIASVRLSASAHFFLHPTHIKTLDSSLQTFEYIQRSILLSSIFIFLFVMVSSFLSLHCITSSSRSLTSQTDNVDSRKSLASFTVRVCVKQPRRSSLLGYMHH